MKSPKIDPLADAINQFEHWRATRTKRGSTPIALRELIQSLKTQYSLSEIAKSLKINYTYLKDPLSSSVSPATFAECPVQPTSAFALSQGISLSFHSKNGLPVTLNGLQSTDIASLIALFLGDASCFN